MDPQALLKLERMLAEATRDLLTAQVQDIPSTITAYLARFGEAVGASRCTWFLMDPGLGRVTSELEWCASGTESILGAAYSRTELPESFTALVEGDDLVAFDTDADEARFTDLRDIVRDEGIRCCVAVAASRHPVSGVLGTDYKSQAPVVDADFLDVNRRFAEIIELARDRRVELEQGDQVRASLVQKHKLETLGLLAGGIAHDFNNALQVVQAATEMLRLEVEDGIARKYVELISDAADSASDLTCRMLIFGRDDSDTVAWTDTSAALRRVLEMVRRLIPESVDTRMLVDVDLPAVPVRRGDFEQAVLNLITNALHAMPDGGRLSVGARVHHEGGGDHVLVTVTDTGVGMGPEELERASEPFFTTKGPDEGTGLGLAIVKSMAHRAGGALILDSVPGKGTSASLQLPAAKRESFRPPAVHSEPPTGTETILVVEDSVLVRRVAQSVLERAGYEVLLADNGLAGLDLLRSRHAVDLVVTDAVMPRMGGRQLYEAARRRGIAPPFLFCTGYSASGLDEGFLEMSGSEVLTKPWKPADLLERVRGILDRNARLRTPITS